MTEEKRYLYKFRSFNEYTLSMLCQSEMYFADPASFNDPLDCRPTLTQDISRPDLERLALEMLTRLHDEAHARKEIQHNRFMAKAPNYEGDEPADVALAYEHLLIRDVQSCLDELVKGKGVCSLSSTWKSPLLWSHYAHEHKGLCIEYEVANTREGVLKPVNYDNNRAIAISTLFEWLISENLEAEEEVLNSYFYSKAPDWEYESEWRLVYAQQGIRERPFRVSAIYFGMKCDLSVAATVIKLMSSVEHIKFYHIYPSNDSYDLTRSEIEVGEYEGSFPRQTGYEAFGGEPYTADLSAIKSED